MVLGPLVHVCRTMQIWRRLPKGSGLAHAGMLTKWARDFVLCVDTVPQIACMRAGWLMRPATAPAPPVDPLRLPARRRSDPVRRGRGALLRRLRGARAPPLYAGGGGAQRGAAGAARRGAGAAAGGAAGGPGGGRGDLRERGGQRELTGAGLGRRRFCSAAGTPQGREGVTQGGEGGWQEGKMGREAGHASKEGIYVYPACRAMSVSS